MHLQEFDDHDDEDNFFASEPPTVKALILDAIHTAYVTACLDERRALSERVKLEREAVRYDQLHLRELHRHRTNEWVEKLPVVSVSDGRSSPRKSKSKSATRSRSPRVNQNNPLSRRQKRGVKAA